MAVEKDFDSLKKALRQSLETERRVRMKRRVLAMAMALAMTFTSLPVNSLTAVAASEFTDGQDGTAPSEDPFSSLPDGEPEDPAGVENGEAAEESVSPGSDTVLEEDAPPEEIPLEQPLEDVTAEEKEEIQNVDGEEAPSGDDVVPGEEGETGESLDPGADPVPWDPVVPEEEIPSQEEDSPYPALTEGMEVTVSITEEEPVRWYRFTPEISGVYTLTSSGSYDTLASVYEDPEGEALRENDDASGSDSNFALSYALEAGKTYYYAVQMCYEFMKGSFDICVDYTRRAVKEAKIASYPQRVYYRELNTPDDTGVSYSGLSLDVAYTDGTVENVSYGYYGSNGLQATNNVQTETLDTGDRVYVPGTYTATVTYGECILEYEIQIKTLEEMPELTLGETVTSAAPELYEYHKITVAEAGEYELQTMLDLTGGSGSNGTVELRDENGVVAPVVSASCSPSRDEGYSGMRLSVYSLEAGKTYYVRRYWSYRVSYGSSAQSSVRVSKVAPMTEGEELTGTEPGYYVRSFVPDVSGVYQVKQTGQGYTGSSVGVTDLSENTASLSDGYYSDGDGWYKEAYLVQSQSYLIYYPYLGNEAASTVSIQLKADDAHILAEGGELSLTGTGQRQVVYVKPEQPGLYCLELEMETGSEEEWGYFYLSGGYSYFYESGFKNDGKTYYRVVRMTGQVCRAKIDAFSIPKGESGTIRLTRLPSVTGFEISQYPRTEYGEGERFYEDSGLEELTAQATYEDGSQEELSWGQVSEKTGLSLRRDSGAEYLGVNLKPGSYTFQIGYLDQSASFRIKVSGTEGEEMPSLTAGMPVSGKAEETGLLKYRFVPETSGFYQVRSTMSMKVLDGAWEEVGRSVSIGSGVSEEAYPYQTDLWLEAGAAYYLYGDVFLDRDYGVAVDAVPVLTLEEDFDVEIPYSGGARWYAFTPETPGIHTVYSYDLTGDAYVELYDAAGNRIAYNDDGGDGLNFCLEHSLGAGKTYYYKFRMLNSGTGSYKVHFQGDARIVTEMEVGQTYDVDASGSEAWYCFTPEVSGMYTVTSEGGPYVSAYLYKDPLAWYVTSNYNGAGDGNFRLSYWMKAGETFYYKFGTNAVASYRVRLQDGTPAMKDLSVGTTHEVDVANPGDEVWYRFTPETDGRYVIYSTSSGSYVYPEIYLYAEDRSSYMDYDANGGSWSNFLLGCDLTANETYYFRTKSSDNYTGTYVVHFEAAPETQSVAVTASPSRIYCENMETSVDYTGLAMAITYQDGTTESLSYGRKSPRTGRKITVTEPEGMWEDDRLKAGTHALQASYDGKEAEFSVVVKGADEMGSFTGSLSGAAADFQNDSMKFSVESDGYYMLRTKYSSVTLEAKVYDTEGNRKYPYKSDYSYYGDDRHTYEVLRLQAEETYLLVLEGTPGAGDYEVVLEAADPLSLTAVDEGTWGTYGKLYSLEITESGYYSLSFDLDVTSGYLDLDCFKENGSGCSYIDYRSGNGHYQKYFYLREGKYFVLSKGNSFGAGYTLSASRIAAPLPLDTEETGTLSESFTLFTFTPSQSGNYTFSSTVTGANAYYGSAQISVYEKGSSIGYGTGSSRYDGELGAYQASYSMGAALTAGEEYLVRLSSSSSSYAGAEYTLRVSLTREVASLELVNAPKQVYYYKLDPLTRDTDLGSGTSVKVTYTEGTEETLSSYDTSAVSGQRYTLRLPETAKYSASGYVLAGTWNAQLTYLNKTISVPIKVKTIGVMPSVEFNESGQGSYSGISEGEDGSGYVRFVAPEDGFYNLTLGAERGSGIGYSNILNGAYDSYRYAPEDVSSESRALVNTSVYVREGQPCYVNYRRSGVGEVSLSVERASDKVITELIPGKEETVSIEKGGDAKWFSFTPTSSGRYHLNSLDAGRSIRAELYLSPDDSNYQASADSYYYSSYNNTNGYDLRLSYDLTAGKTYYYKTAYSYDSYTGTYRMVLVKESRAKSLELLTEGQIYCSSLPGFVANSFANLEFQITYEDDTTETMTFGYKGGTQRNYSLQGRRISYDAPSFSNDDGTPIEDGMYTVNFHYDGVSCQVDDVLVCAVSGLDSAQGTFQAEIGAGAYKYYRYAPEESGYYRVMASGRTSYPSVVMFDKYMQEIAPLYTNSYLKDGAYSRVCVYNLGGITETGDGYCLRLGNSSSAAMSVECTLEKMSQATGLQVSSYPQLDYYLGVDSSFAPDGLALLVTYGDGTTETLSYGDNSTVTGLSLEVQVGDSVDGSLYLGSSGSKIVLVRYMDQTASLEINVKDPADVGEMTDTAAVSGEIATVRDYAYVKYTAAKSGFYDFMLTGEGTVPYISYIRNASYTELESFDYYSGGARYDSSLTALGNRSTRHYLVYLLEGKTYYMKGYLTENGQRTSGSYEASVAPLEDLRDASCGGTLDGGKTAVYQLTAWADGYYQFTLQGVNNGAVRIYNSSFNAIKATYGEEDGRKYAAARLRAGNAYFVACVNQGSGETAYSVQADKRPEVTSISIAQEPEKPVYYAQFENSVNPGGLVVSIHYADGTQEELAYGESSQWGLSLSLDTTTIQKDENGNFETGTQTVGVIYLDKRASFTIEVQDFDIASALAMEAEKWEDVDLSAGASAFYVFTPEKDVEYRYYSHGDAAVVGYIYDSGYDLLTSGTGGGDKDFSLNCELKKGESYILRVRGLSAKAPISTKVRVHDTTAWIEVTSLSLAQDEMILGSIGETQALTAIVKPDNADYKDQISWTSADSQIVSVDEKGVVTAQKEGETTVTATAEDGGYQASCTVYVDLKDPQLTEVYPADKTVMGPSASTMWIYAQDNVGVEKVTVEYKKSTEAEYTLSVDSDKDEGNGQSSVNKAQLPVGDDYFQDGDEINVRVTACDKGGRKSQPQERTYVIDKKAPSVTNASAVHDTDLRAVKVTWKGNQEEDISGYAIYRKVKDASEDTYQYLGTCQGYVNQADYSYVDDKVENKDQVYTYKIAASDQRGNTAEFVLENTEVTRINEEPVIRLNCQSTMISGEAYAFDLSGSTDDGSIVSWSVDYGDDWADEGQTGQTSYTHTYTLPEGTADAAYTVKVTATDDEGAKATLEKSVRVVDLANASMVTVTVVDKRGLTLENAPVYVNMGEDTQEKLTTDGKGKVEYIALPGFTTVGSYMEGYLPVKRTIQAEAGKKAEVTLVLEKKDLVEARFESHRMTLDEIRDAGIDVSDPANHHVVEYQVTLMYSTVKFRYNGKGVCDIEGSGDYHYIPYVLDDEVIVILEIPVKASILKEFYEVNMYIINNASEDFSLLDNHVKLNVPDGLTVMEGEGAAAVETDIPEIKGQSTELVTWILRGDKEGEYDLTADYRGVLSDFNEPVSATFKSDKKITVYGVSNMEITLQIPESFTDGEFYYNLVMRNKGTGNDADMYLPQLSGAGDLIQTKYTKEDGTGVCVDEMPEVLRAGESITKNYLITDQIYEQLHEKYPDYESFVFYFKNMWIEEVSSYGIPLIVEFLTWEDMKATYDSYRAQVPEVTKLEAVGAVYGYKEGDAYLEVEGKAADGAEYDLSYEWYDTSYDTQDAQPIGEGSRFVVPAGLDAGEYHYHCVVIATRKDNKNKAQTQYQDVVLTIAPKPVTLVWSGNETRTYNGEPSNVTAAVVETGLLGEDTCTVTVTGGTEVYAGTHTATAASLSNENYALPEENTCQYVIEPKVVTLIWSGNEIRTYDGEPSNVTAAVNQEDLIGEDTCTVEVDGGTEVYAGTHTATAASLSNENYALPEEKTCQYVIEPKVVTLIWSGNETRTYDGEPSNVTAAVNQEDLVGEDTCTVTVTGGIEVDAGTYTATADGLSNENYKLPEEKTCQYTIDRREVTLTWSGNETRTYDGEASNVTAEAGNLVGKDICTVTVTGGTEVHAGNHTATAASLSNENYKLPEENTCQYVIEPKAITLTWSGNETRTYNGEPSNVTAAVNQEDLIGEDTCTVTVAGGTEVQAGTHRATAASLSSQNYALPEENTCQYIIAPKVVTLTWSGNETRTYDGEPSNVTAAVNQEDLVGEDTCTVEVAGGSEINAGTYEAEAASLSNENYALPGEKTCQYVIEPKEVTLTWSGNETRTYDKKKSSVTAKAEGLVKEDVCNVTVTGGEAVNAGTHTATAESLDNDNYVLPAEKTCAYTIQKKEVTLIWSGDTARIYDGTPSAVTAKTDGIEEGDLCEVSSVTGGTEVKAGTHEAQAEGLQGTDSGNYRLPENASHKYTIEPKEVTLKWSGTEDRIYNGQKSQVEAALEGLVGDDICTVASVTGSDEIHAGAHTARVESLEGADSGNYRLPEDPTCTYNILPKEITVSWSGNADRIYDGTASMVAASPVGLVAGDACAVTVTGGNGVNAGTHTATAAALDNGDYALSGEVTCAYTIRPKEITVSWSGNADRIYDGTASAVAASPVGLVAGDACTVAVTGGNGVNAGTHTATTAGLDNGNYVLAAQASCTYTIQPREAVLSWSGNGERIYDGAASNVAATVANLAAGDICGVTVTGGNEVNAGTHTATAVGLDNGNYILPAQASCAYTIGKAEQSLTVAKTSYTQAVKKAFMLGVSASGEVTYTSSNSKIAKVDASGKVTPLRSGKAVITVEAKETENYKGAAREIEIYVRPANVASFKAKAGKRKITLKWKKQAGVSGYQIQYSTSKKFTKKTTKTVNVKASAKKYTLKKLASKKRYYVRIRAYKTINRVKYYSPKFRTKKVKVK